MMEDLIDFRDQVHLGDTYYPPEALRPTSGVERRRQQELEAIELQALFAGAEK